MANVLSIVSYKILPAKLGGQKGIALFNEYFSKRHSLFCVTVKANDPVDVPYKVFNLLSNSPLRYSNIFYFGLVKRIIKEYRITHIILEHPYYGWLGMLLSYFCRVKLVVHSHNIESERFKTTGKWWWKILWHYERFIHANADFTFCITREDRDYFFKEYKIGYEKSAVITYGIPWDTVPSATEKAAAKSKLTARYSIPGSTLLFLFNGTLHYGPNLDAVKNIVDQINPIFIKNRVDYKIIICGKGLPDEMNELKSHSNKNIIYAGFVDDITAYFMGVDVFINPVTDGGGIKTKLVEALGYNLNVVSTDNGAIGVDEAICNGKLFLCRNGDWYGFAEAMKKAPLINRNTPKEFFDHFYWENIAGKAAAIITDL